MRKKPAPIEPLPEAVGRGTERSALFWLFYDRHAEIVARWEGRRICWPTMCTWAIERKAWVRTGEPPKTKTAKVTWARVCALKAREAARRQAKQRPARVPTPRTNVPPPTPAPVQPRPPVSWVVPPALPAPSHSRPTAGEPVAAPMTEGQRLAAEMLEKLKRRR